MKREKVLGWILFTCGTLGGLYLLAEPIGYLSRSLGGILAILASAKSWGFIGAGIAIWWGWNLSHKHEIPRYSLSWREDIQQEVDASVFILRCIAKRMGVKRDRIALDESQIKLVVSFNIMEIPKYGKCGIFPSCGAYDECHKIRKVVDSLLDQGLRAREREIIQSENGR